MQVLPFAAAHACAVGQLPLHHSDPFDRALVARCQVEKLRLVSSDRLLQQYSNEIDRMYIG